MVRRRGRSRSCPLRLSVLCGESPRRRPHDASSPPLLPEIHRRHRLLHGHLAPAPLDRPRRHAKARDAEQGPRRPLPPRRRRRAPASSRPTATTHYSTLRRGIGFNAPNPHEPTSLLDLGRASSSSIPACPPLMPYFDSGLCAAAHAVGYDKNTRSHFEEQDTWETGFAGNTIKSDGWLNRHLVTSTGRGPIRAVSIGDALPRIMQGKAPAYAVRGLELLTLPRTARAIDPETVSCRGLEHAYVDAAKAGQGPGHRSSRPIRGHHARGRPPAPLRHHRHIHPRKRRGVSQERSRAQALPDRPPHPRRGRARSRRDRSRRLRHAPEPGPRRRGRAGQPRANPRRRHRRLRQGSRRQDGRRAPGHAQRLRPHRF